MPESPSAAAKGGARNAFMEGARLHGFREGEPPLPPDKTVVTSKPLPRWVILVASAVILFHLFAVGLRALAVFSGPWPNPDGIVPATPPQFAYSMHQGLVSKYLNFLHLTHNYHFVSNRPGMPAARLEIKLKDKDGQVIETVNIPDKKANPWRKHREDLLARNLAQDEPVPPPEGEHIAAPGRKAPTVVIWEPKGETTLVLHKVERHLTPRDRPVFKPSDWSMVLARAYCRRLQRESGAASVELIRHSQEPYPPAVLFIDSLPTNAFPQLNSNFQNGEEP